MLLGSLLSPGHLLSPEGEGGAGDGCGQVQAFGDLPPDLLIDDLHQAPLLCDQFIQHVQVQDLLGHDGNPIDRGACDCPTRERAGSVKLNKKTSNLCTLIISRRDTLLVNFRSVI